MSRDALNHLDDALRELRAAMESGDADRMTAAMAIAAPAVDAVRAVGAWRADPELRTQVKDMRQRLDSDHLLARLLHDMTGRQLSILADRAPTAAPLTYRRA